MKKIILIGARYKSISIKQNAWISLLICTLLILIASKLIKKKQNKH